MAKTKKEEPKAETETIAKPDAAAKGPEVDLRDREKGTPLADPMPSLPKVAAAALAPGEQAYRISFLCSNKETFVLDQVGAVNDLSIALACNAAALALLPRVMGYAIIRCADGTKVADVGLLDFVAAVTPKVSAAIRQPILNILHLKEGQKLEDAVEDHMSRRDVKKTGG